jgi:antitoxin (DNA-binding transcriptional repressor) of toxin-antitoxin stability system
MSSTVPVEVTQANLKELIGNLAPGDEIVITLNQKPVAKLVGERAVRSPRPAPGLGKGSILYTAPDFDEPLDEFKDYME